MDLTAYTRIKLGFERRFDFFSHLTANYVSRLRDFSKIFNILSSLIPYKRLSFPYSDYDFLSCSLFLSSLTFLLCFLFLLSWRINLAPLHLLQSFNYCETLTVFSGGQSGFPVVDSMILSPPPRKVGIYLKTFEARLPLPLTDFQEELLSKNGYNIQMLTPNVVNKMVAFEMICRANEILPDFYAFKFFFRFCATNDKFIFSARRGGHVLVPDGKTPKNWKTNGFTSNGNEFVMGTIRQITSQMLTLSCFRTTRLLLTF